MLRKLIISLPMVATIILLSAASITTIVAYGQDFLIGDVNDPVLSSTELEERIGQRVEQERQAERQEYLRQKELQIQQQQAANPTTPTATTNTTTTTLAQDPEFVRFGEVAEQCVNSAAFGSSGATMTQEQCTQFLEQGQEKWCGLAAYDAQKCEHTSRITAAWNNLVNLSEGFGFSDIPSLGELGIDPRTIAPSAP